MDRVLKYISAFFGILLVLAGILKSFNMFYSMELHWGELYLRIPNSNSIIYNLIVNFIGGFSMTYHSITTLKFNKNEIEHCNNNNASKPMSNFILGTGFTTILISFFFFIRTLVIISLFEGSIMLFLPLIIFAILLYGIFFIIPAIVVAKNITLNNQIESIIKSNSIK